MRKDQKTWIVWGVVAALFLAFFFWIGSPQKFAACGLLDPKSGKILFGCWGKGFFEALTDNFDAGFRAFSGAFNKALETLVKALLGTLPVLQENLPTALLAAFPCLLAALISGLAWVLQRSWVLVVGVAIGLLFVINQGLWKQTVETLVLVVASASASMAIGVPIGIYAAHRPNFYKFLQPVLDMMQTLPTFVYLIPVLTLFGLGNAPGLVVTIIFVIPTAVRLTHLGMVSVPKAIIEAGEAFGATKRQLLWKVEFPSALPTIMAGLTQAIMLSLSMVVFAALIGAGGLGSEINRALGSRKLDLGLEAGAAIVIIAIILDRMCQIGKGAKS